MFEADADLVVIAGRKSVQDKFVKLAMTKQKDAPEWERPRWAEAVEIRLGMDETSLATRRAKPPAEQAEAAGRAKLAMEAVDARALEVLRAHPMLEMTDTAFAVKLAAWRPEGGETLGIGEQAVRKNWLPRLRAEDCSVREHYDVGKGRWRYHPPATKED